MDNISQAAPPVPPVPAKPKRSRTAFNKEYLAELDEADLVTRTAQQPDYAAPLADFGISAVFVADLQARAVECRRLFNSAASTRGQKGAATDDKAEDELALEAAMRRVQTGARLKYDGAKPDLDRYFVGVDLTANEARLQQMATAMLQNLETDTLPGVGAPQKTALQAALDAWIQESQAQQDHGSTSTGDYAHAVQMLTIIKRDRRKIQIAADGEYPYTAANSATPRRDFDLPPRRPFA